MSIIDTLTGKKRRGRPPIPPLVLQAPAIAKKIELADAKLADLRSQHGRAALDAVSGVEGAQARLDGIEAQIGATEHELATLSAAHGTAVADDQAALAIERARNRANDLRRFETLQKQSQDATLDFQTLQANAVSAYRRMVVHRRKAYLAAQSAGFQLPGNNLLHDGEIQALVDRELFRVGDKIDRGDPLHFTPSFPRRGHYLAEHPSQQTPIHDRIVRQDAITLATLKGERPADPTPVAAPQPPAAPPAHLADDIDAEAERAAIRAMMRKPGPPVPVEPEPATVEPIA